MKKVAVLCLAMACVAGMWSCDNGNNGKNKSAGLFSISATEQVMFAPGNLQYNPAKKKWQFAERQYEVIGTANANVSATYNGWIDLFGWGTSGYADNMPFTVSTKGDDYGPAEGDIYGSNYDWGIYSKIDGGGWRTISMDEWEYVFSGRENAWALQGLATVCGVKGILLMPDGWVPDEYGEGPKFESVACEFFTNVYDETSWQAMEKIGAAFFPLTGKRVGTQVSETDESGYYWTTEERGECNATGVQVHYNSKETYGSGFWRDLFSRSNGMAVRLVKDVKGK